MILKEEYAKNIIQVKRVSDRVMSRKLEIESVLMNHSNYAQQVGCEMKDKENSGGS